MGKLVTVKPGYAQVLLPDGKFYTGGQTATLTDAEYAALAANTLRLISLTTSGLADPVRNPTTPVSLADALKTAETYSDGARAKTLVATANVYTVSSASTNLISIVSPTANFTIANDTATPSNGQRLIIRILSGATGYTPTWGTGFRASGTTTLPVTALPASKTVTLEFIYDSTAAKWVLLVVDATGY